YACGRVIVAARGGEQRQRTGGGVIISSRSEQCLVAGCRVIGASVIAKQRLHTDGRVVVAGATVCERVATDCRVVAAGCVTKEGRSTDSRVAGAACEAEERIIAFRRVTVRITSVWCRAQFRPSWRLNLRPREDQGEGDDNRTASQRRLTSRFLNG